MDVDESRRDGVPARVDLDAALLGDSARHGGNPAPGNGDVHLDGGGTRAVDDVPAPDHDVVRGTAPEKQ